MTAKPLRRLAVWTPDLSGVNGQNIVTRQVVKAQRQFFGTVYEYPNFGLASIPGALWQAMRLFVSVVSKKHDGVYLVSSRSTMGFLRDVIPLLTSRLGVRVIAHVHGSDFLDLLSRGPIGAMARWLYAGCEVIVPSSHLAEPLARHCFSRLIFCDNFSDGADYSDQMLLPRADRAQLVVLWNSNIMASKGIAELVEAIRQLRQESASIKLVMLGKPIGDAEYSLTEMNAFVDKMRQEDWIDVVGAVSPEDVPSYIACSDVIALPSEYSSECQPLAVIQGMLAGRAVLVSDTPAMRATVGDFPAIFTDRNAKAISEALRRLIGGHYHQPSRENVLRSRERFSVNRFDRCIALTLLSSNAPSADET